MTNENENDGCSMKDELMAAREERDAEIPMPDMKKTEELMSPGSGDVED